MFDMLMILNNKNLILDRICENTIDKLEAYI